MNIVKGIIRTSFNLTFLFGNSNVKCDNVNFAIIGRMLACHCQQLRCAMKLSTHTTENEHLRFGFTKC